MRVRELIISVHQVSSALWFYFPRTLTRPQKLCLKPQWKESHSSMSAACFLLAEMCVGGSCSERERASQKLQAHFITAHCVCAWRRHVPFITETIWHQHADCCCMLPNLGISVAAIPYSNSSRSRACVQGNLLSGVPGQHWWIVCEGCHSRLPLHDLFKDFEMIFDATPLREMLAHWKCITSDNTAVHRDERERERGLKG